MTIDERMTNKRMPQIVFQGCILIPYEILIARSIATKHLLPPTELGLHGALEVPMDQVELDEASLLLGLSTKDKSNTMARTESKSRKSSDEEDVVSVLSIPTPEDFEDVAVESGTKQDEENFDSFSVSNVCTLLSCQY